MTPVFQLGANVTLTDVMEAFHDRHLPGGKYSYLPECVEFMKRIAHLNVRNVRADDFSYT